MQWLTTVMEKHQFKYCVLLSKNGHTHTFGNLIEATIAAEKTQIGAARIYVENYQGVSLAIAAWLDGKQTATSNVFEVLKAAEEAGLSNQKQSEQKEKRFLVLTGAETPDTYSQDVVEEVARNEALKNPDSIVMVSELKHIYQASVKVEEIEW
jgi:hypothetical protein